MKNLRLQPASITTHWLKSERISRFALVRFCCGHFSPKKRFRRKIPDLSLKKSLESGAGLILQPSGEVGASKLP